MEKEEVMKKLTGILNELLEMDPEAIRELCFDKRVVCNEKLAKHPKIQASMYDPKTKKLVAEKGLYMVGLLGILNGFAEDLGYVIYVVAEDDEGELHKFYYKTIKEYFGDDER